jgi:hypothetical protein
LSASQRQTIISTTGHSLPVRENVPILIAFDRSPLIGTDPRKAVPGTVSMARQPGRTGRRLSESANSAAQHTNPSRCGVLTGSARISASQHGDDPPASTTRPEPAPIAANPSPSTATPERGPVPVSARGGFVAFADALRYVCMELFGKPQPNWGMA